MANKIPHNLEAEKAVLGSMIENDKIRIDALAMLTEEDFYGNNSAHRHIFRAMCNLDNAGKVIDTSTLTDELLNHMHTLDSDGGTDYLVELQEAYIGEKHALQHINIVKDLSVLRRLLDEMRNIIQDYNEKPISSVPDFVGNSEKRILDITKYRRVGSFKNSGEIADIIAKKLEANRGTGKGLKTFTGIDTGFTNLNNLTLGLQPGSLCILAARPSVGKTTFAINIAYNAAANTGKTVAIFSLEMSAEAIVQKMITLKSKIVSDKLQTGNLSDDDWIALDEARKAIKGMKILIDDTSAAKLNDIRTKAQKLKNDDENLGLIVIDYMGLITTTLKTDNRQAEVSEISRSLKALARELNIPILCLCQLSRMTEKRTDRRPVLSDLRDSGSIEQDADQVLFIYRPNYQKYDSMEENNKEDNNPQEENNNQNQNDAYDKKEETHIILSKNRMGKVGVAYYWFFPSIGLFMPMDPPERKGE